MGTAADKFLTVERFSRQSGRIPGCTEAETFFGADNLFKGIDDPKFKEFCFDIPDGQDDFDSFHPEIHPSNGCEYNRYLITEEQSGDAYESDRYGRISNVLYYGAELYYFTDSQVKVFIQRCKENGWSSVGDAFLFIVRKKGQLFLVSMVIKSDGLHIDCSRYKNYFSVQVPHDCQRCYFVARAPSFWEVFEAHDM